MADRQTQSRDGATVKNDHSLLVWVLDQTLGLLQSSARTAEQEEAVKELRTLALLPKPDKAKLEALVHRLETLGSTNPESARTPRTPKRAETIEARPVRITLDRQLTRLIESIGKKAGARSTPGKKAAVKKTAATAAGKKAAVKKTAVKSGGKKTTAMVGAKKSAAKAGAKKSAARAGAKKSAVKGGGKKTPKTVAGRKAAKKVGGKKTAAPKNVFTKRTRT